MANSVSNPLEGVGRQVATTPYDKQEPIREKEVPKDGMKTLATDRVTVSESGRVIQKLASSLSSEVRPEMVTRYKEAIQKGALKVDADSIAWGILLEEIY